MEIEKRQSQRERGETQRREEREGDREKESGGPRENGKYRTLRHDQVIP